MKKINPFTIYLIALIPFFTIAKNTIYKQKEAPSVVEIIPEEERECFRYSYFFKNDKSRKEYFTYDQSILDETIHEIFFQKINCPE